MWSCSGSINTMYPKQKELARSTFRDSLNLLPCSLDVLAKNLCPELGKKGDIDHNKMTFESIKDPNIKAEVLSYLEQDIRLLAGVLLSAQEIYHRNFDVDITDWVTISSKALGIFRSKFLPYDYEQKDKIYIPTMNVDNFVRKGYFGGRAEAYMPKGSHLYYYDVNSLYPYIMKEHDMPGGKPVWHGEFPSDVDLDSLYGFIEAYVECPKNIKKVPANFMKYYSFLNVAQE